MLTPLLAKALPPILAPNPGLMIWTLVTFFIAMLILYRKAFKPIQAALEKRRLAIAESVEQAERTREEARQMLVEYRQQLAEARKEAQGIVEDARKAGDELTARVRQEAEEQRRLAVESTQAQVQAEVEKAMSELRSGVAEMTVLAAEKVLRGAVDLSAHQRLIEQAVEELDFDRLQKVGSA